MADGVRLDGPTEYGAIDATAGVSVVVEREDSGAAPSRARRARMVSRAVLVAALALTAVAATHRAGDSGLFSRAATLASTPGSGPGVLPTDPSDGTEADDASSSTDSGGMPLDDTSSADEYEVGFKLWTRYIEEYGEPAHSYPWMSEYAGLAEPNVDTYLVATCTNLLNATAGCPEHVSYIWSFPSTTQGVPATTTSGDKIRQVFTQLMDYTVTVSAQLEGATVASSTGTVICRYVRRELRQLFADDRNALLDAMKVMWETSTSDGQGMYGPSYVAVSDLASYHVTLASDVICDHMHDGLGFLPQHMALTMMFEQSLQAVDSQVSLAYWDFTIDKFHYDSGNWTSLSDSPMWKSDWFGHQDGEYNTITEGRWEYIEVESEHWAGSHNSYGYMRAPWNNNNRPYVTRSDSLCGEEFTSLPSCKVHWYTLEETSTWTDFAWVLPYEPHGPVHIYVGGALDCNSTYDGIHDYLGLLGLPKELEYERQKEKLMYLLRTDMYVTLKDMYRAGYLEFPTSCTLDTPFEDCHATCVDLSKLEHAITVGKESYIHMYWEMMFAWASDTQYFEWLSWEVKGHVIKMVCENGIGVDGDQLESGSPMDPSFWSIHPTMERLWMYKKLTNTFDSEEWPDHDYSTVSNCYGHASNSTTPFEFALKTTEVLDATTRQDDNWNQSSYTNAEIMDAADPGSNSLPYVYQDFMWSHCALAGWDFSLIGDDDDGASANGVPTGGDDGSGMTPQQAHLLQKDEAKIAKAADRVSALRAILKEEELPKGLQGI